MSLPQPEPERWFRRPDRPGAARVRSETLRMPGGALRASFRACDDSGCVVIFPALPQLMARGASYQHARIKALALVQRHLRKLAARTRQTTPAPAAPRRAA